MQSPIIVLNQTQKRENGRKAQLSCIQAGKMTADIIRTCLGPQAMLKMILDSMGTLVITNDGNSILREIDVAHPASKSLIELARGQDEEVGDGTTTVVVLAGEILAVLEPLLKMNIHPHVIVAGLRKALEDALAHLEKIKVPIDNTSDSQMLSIIKSAIGTKFLVKWSDLIAKLALDTVRLIRTEDGFVDLKRQVRIERIIGGELEDSYVMHGVLINKDVVHSHMRRHIDHPKVLILDSGLEYRKGESITTIEITGENDYANILAEEEQQVRQMCEAVIATGANLVVVEKGISDLACHYLAEAGITALRRFQQVQLDRIAACTGATIVTRPSEATEADLGTKCGVFDCRKIGDEFWSFFDECENPKACTMVLRGPSKDVLLEMFRIMDDALKVARNLMSEPSLLPGGGATEISVSTALRENCKKLDGIEQMSYETAALALEVIPRTLIQNCGAPTMKVLTQLKSIHAADPSKASMGIDGMTGKIADMAEKGIWDTFSVKAQAYKTAFECAISLLRVDDIVSGIIARDENGNPVNKKSVTEKLDENTAAALAGQNPQGL
ncbi:chaperonin subunit gamma CCTgamma, putative [Trichomonas vaginalis G3]|uniref:T-complex protein 1 subunit gamma n=2 Tax=Trichomonas vaginalis TaxID=5722 RepID=A2F520_TRIV3|nr:chaperonin family [Trichomonas vaginalis G3]EAY00024.1 chaperonin subunit gamma CCTgamma, putative [Trichomonas vaginalis G3]KAI5523525.1 chaperonin family [Trichomonas vaginalis G3]|eukprot:XP_001312953.1 chaperonin subunit gamma CCTgamma [Trichomonas vaginalis G3]